MIAKQILILTLAMIASTAYALAQDNPDDATQRVTGCLKKNTANVYVLMDENGKLWDLHSKNVSFAQHVGHTVTVSGTIPQKSKDNPDDTSPQNHLIVTKLDMVSDTCKQ